MKTPTLFFRFTTIELLVMLLFILCFGCIAQTTKVKVSVNNLQSSFEFKSGDLIFQDLDCGDLCEAIEKVTFGINGKSFSHIGLVYINNGSGFVIEAIGKDVHLTKLSEFIARSKDKKGNPKIIVGRLKSEYLHLNDQAIQFALKQIGTPYDDEFIYENQKYYCSELIYDAYKSANKNKPFFELQPMTFNDPATGKPFPVWQKYYQDLKREIPEGDPGINPAGISRSGKIEIIKSFYD